MMKSQDLVGDALENNCDLVIKDNEFRILKSDVNANAYRFTNIDGVVSKELIENKDFTDINRLLTI
jgi:hypothetical protein